MAERERPLHDFLAAIANAFVLRPTITDPYQWPRFHPLRRKARR
jgi:hypothetical protein